ncbi:MAG: DUF4350 domain-containing protein [Bacteroidia bacterium]
MKSYRTYIIVITVLFIAFVVVEYYKPKPLNWDKTYINKDKIPYGTYVMYDVLKDVFPGMKIQTIRKPIYNHLQNYFYYSENDSGEEVLKPESEELQNYLFIADNFSSDTLDVTYLLYFVETGNSVFIAASDFNSPLFDTLNIEPKYSASIKNDSVKISFINKEFNQPYKIKRSDADHYFLSKDSTGNQSMQVLAVMDSNRATFIRAPFGKGNFYICSTPVFFSNIQLLEEHDNDFAYKALSYLPVKEVFWDEYQKQGAEGEDSLLRAVLAQESLRWSYYIALASMIIFIVFEAKRRQRIIPVIEPLANSTLEFTRTLGNLYLSKGDHKNIGTKKIQYFFDFIRDRYRLQTNEVNDELIKAIAEKSGSEKSLIDDIFRMINFVQYNNSISEKNLLDFNSLLEKFYLRSA